jgi:hypothetical protein
MVRLISSLFLPRIAQACGQQGEGRDRQGRSLPANPAWTFKPVILQRQVEPVDADLEEQADAGAVLAAQPRPGVVIALESSLAGHQLHLEGVDLAYLAAGEEPTRLAAWGVGVVSPTSDTRLAVSRKATSATTNPPGARRVLRPVVQVLSGEAAISKPSQGRPPAVAQINPKYRHNVGANVRLLMLGGERPDGIGGAPSPNFTIAFFG